MDAAPTAAPETIREAQRRIAHIPLVLSRRNFSWLTERISGVVELPAPRWWWVAFTITASTATFGIFCIGYQISTGVGTWGNQIPVGWAWDITNFVFWIGIGHAGTLISAILFLLRQKWRTSINRSAEAMTLFAVICAAIFPGIHVGRFWMAWYMAPIPNNWGIWQNFRSALVGRVRGIDIFYRVGFVLVHRFGSGLGDVARSRDHADQEISIWNFCSWLARLESALAPLRNGVSAVGRSINAAGSLGAQRRIIRLRLDPCADVAHDYFSALLRRRRNLRRLCDGADAALARARNLQVAGRHHAAARRQNGEDYFVDGLIRRLRLCDGVLHCLV